MLREGGSEIEGRRGRKEPLGGKEKQIIITLKRQGRSVNRNILRQEGAVKP